MKLQKKGVYVNECKRFVTFMSARRVRNHLCRIFCISADECNFCRLRSTCFNNASPTVYENITSVICILGAIYAFRAPCGCSSSGILGSYVSIV